MNTERRLLPVIFAFGLSLIPGNAFVSAEANNQYQSCGYLSDGGDGILGAGHDEDYEQCVARLEAPVQQHVLIVEDPVILKSQLEQIHAIRLNSFYEDGWDLDRLRLAHDIFSRFPKKFIERDDGIPKKYLEWDPDIGILKLNLALNTLVFTPWSDTRNIVYFREKDFTRDKENEVTIKLIHEIVHRNTYRGIIIDYPEPGVGFYVLPPYFRKVYSIFGGSLELPPEKFSQWAQNTKQELIEKGEWDDAFEDISNLKLRFVKAITHNYPHEVPSVLAEQLVYRGREKFIRDLRGVFPVGFWSDQKLTEILGFVQDDLLYGQVPERFLRGFGN